MNFNLLQLARGKICCIPRPPLPCPYPCAWPLAHNHRATPRDRSLAGRPCHPHALRRRHGYHSAAAWAVRRGARQWLERSNLLIQPILTPENAGTTSHAPCTALTLSLAHVAVRRRMPLALAADADGRTTFSRPGCRSNSPASSSQLRRPIVRETRGRAGPPSRLGRVERSFGACAPRGWVVSYFGWLVCGLVCDSEHAVWCAQHLLGSIRIDLHTQTYAVSLFFGGSLP